MLDKVQKRKPITDTEARVLKNKGLIEGKRPHYYISVSIAQSTGQKASYTRHKAFDTQQYFDWIIKGIADHGSLGRQDINDLLLDKLSDLFDNKQKNIKINNIIATLRQKGVIKNIGTDSKPKWVLIKVVDK